MPASGAIGRGVTAFFAASLLASACSPTRAPTPRATDAAPPSETSTAANTDAAGAHGTAAYGNPDFPNWPTRPVIDGLTMRIVDDAPIELVETSGAGAGTTGAEKMFVEVETLGHTCRLKAKEFPRDLDGMNNSPRKELAAYALQRLFLVPEDYVVPTTLPRCIVMSQWEPHHPGATPTIPGSDCVLVTLAMWLEYVTLPDEVLDMGRFRTDPVYALYMSNFNVFTYLVDHRDGRRGNFLISNLPGRPQTFAVDNGISFGPWVFNYFVRNWYKIRVPAVRADTVEKLRGIEREDLDFLLALFQLEPGDEGRLRLVKPGEPDDPDRGATRVGSRIQLGLTEREIDDVWKRINALVARVDSGDLATF